MTSPDPLVTLRRTRPDFDDSWARSDSGRLVLRTSLQRAEAPTPAPSTHRPRRRRATTLVLAAASVLVVGSLGYGLVDRAEEEGPRTGGYALDVNDLGTLVHASSDVVVVRVTGRADTASGDTSTYRVVVDEVVKGDAAGEVLVEQYATSIDPDQTRLSIGGTYLVVGSIDAGALVVAGGPLSVREIGSEAQQRRLVAEYKAADLAS